MSLTKSPTVSLNSMTGFARADGALGDAQWHWEIKSVNGKGLDCRFRLPPGFEALEPDCKKLLAKHIARGNCQANLQLDRSRGDAALQVNEAALRGLLAAAKTVQAAARAEGLDVAPVSVDGLLATRGLLQSEEAEDEEAHGALIAAIAGSFEEMAAGLATARAEEGAKLATILTGQVDRIEALTQEAASSPASGADAIKRKLQSQITDLLAGTKEIAEDRLAQEAALLATKADIREELDRLMAHVAQARELMASGKPAGRRLDFLTQEFNREANTLCSKAADVDITRIGLELKAVIDQLKEQVQNVE